MQTDKGSYTKQYIDLCRNCRGIGKLDINQLLPFESDICPVCLGHGRVKVVREIKTTIETLNNQ